MAAIRCRRCSLRTRIRLRFNWPASVRRVLLVRPTSFEYLVRLRQLTELYTRPTCCATRRILRPALRRGPNAESAGWKKWSIIGPTLPDAAEEEISEVRKRFDVSGDQELCVFSMAEVACTSSTRRARM